MKMRMMMVMAVLLSSIGARLHAETAVSGRGGVLELNGAGVRMSPMIFNRNWQGLAVSGAWSADETGALKFTFSDAGDAIAEGVARFTAEDGGLRCRWEYKVLRDFTANCVCVGIDLPCVTYAGGSIAFDDEVIALPDSLEKAILGGKSAKRMSVAGANGIRLDAECESPCWMMVQDNRQWNGSAFAARINFGDTALVAGAVHALEFTVSASSPITYEPAGETVITRGFGWIPIADTTDIKAGSALDFSKMGWIDAPAGRHGRVVVRNGHFEFERSKGVVRRFYGVNLCFGANYLSESEADELCSRLTRMGYNALRIHHYERMLVDPSDGTTILENRMAELDNLLNACIKHGIYLTTDLFVSRPVPWRSCGIDRDGNVPMDEYKELIQFHEGAYRNYLEFARAFLGHVNPKTGRSWAEEPAVAFIALVNEGNLGNTGYSRMGGYEAIKGRWSKDIPSNCWANDRLNAEFTLLLGDIETAFARKMRRFLEEELGCKALITDMSSWFNPIAYQLPRDSFDYVDDHFYVDHPQFIEQSWRLPSKCGNANPVRSGGAGFQSVAFHRTRGKPFTITEFNYSVPGSYRGVGGMMLGAQAALQDYDGVWRFAWSHSRDGVMGTGPLGYFDTAIDPLQRATERAALMLFMRRDMKPLAKDFTIAAPERVLRGDFSSGPIMHFDNPAFGWYRRISVTTEDITPADGSGAVFPKAYSLGKPYLDSLVSGERMGDGQIKLDQGSGMFAVDTPLTVGAFAEKGAIRVGSLDVAFSINPAALWLSSLDGREIAKSKRMLLTHVTDVQDEGMTYADRKRQVLVKWGRAPHLMARGVAEVSLALKGSKKPMVYALDGSGERMRKVQSRFAKGRLEFKIDNGFDPDVATCFYEIVR